MEVPTMAETPIDTTNRLKVFYSGPYGNHSLLFHGRTGTSESALVSSVRNVIDLFAVLMYDTVVFDSAQYAAAGSTLFFPTAWASIDSTGTTVPDINRSPGLFIQFGARGNPDGIRTKLYLFESGFLPRADMRYEAGENADLDAAIAELQSQDDVIGNIAGGGVIWYNYTNVGENDFITHRARAT